MSAPWEDYQSNAQPSRPWEDYAQDSSSSKNSKSSADQPGKVTSFAAGVGNQQLNSLTIAASQGGGDGGGDPGGGGGGDPS